MTWPKVQTITGTFLAFANAAVIMVVSLGIVTWTDPQKGLVLAVVNAGVGLVVAVYAHFLPGTPPEPVAVAGGLTAFAAAVIALAVGFDWWSLTQAQAGAVVSVVVALVAFGGSMFARSHVTPTATSGPLYPVPHPDTRPGATPQGSSVSTLPPAS